MDWLCVISRILAFAAACLIIVTPAAAEAPPDQVAAYGHVSPGERILTVTVPYYAGAPQVIAEVLVKEGDKVSKDQKLAVTNNKALAAAEVVLARARLKVAAERLNALNAGPKNEDIAAQEALIKSLEAEARADKNKKRTDAAATSRETLAHGESLDWKVKVAQYQLRAMREVRPADIAVARAEIAEAETAVARVEAIELAAEIVSPVTGQILKILAYPGEGAVGQGLLEIGETQTMLIKAELNVADASRVKPGARAVIKSDAWRGEIAGTVTRVRPMVERSLLSAPSTFSNVDRAIVEATISPEAPERLAGLSGAEVTVQITADSQGK